tara:strand:+ start:416 stop:754 length:339 start_codon:yes stop_codon:yes gene_type:complete
MENKPISDGDNGRDKSGKFTEGNPGGPGNPHAKKIAEYRRAVRDAFSKDHVLSVLNSMYARACGDGKDAVPASRVFLEYTIGKPKESVEVSAGEGSLTFIVKPARKRTGDDE